MVDVNVPEHESDLQAALTATTRKLEAVEQELAELHELRARYYAGIFAPDLRGEVFRVLDNVPGLGGASHAVLRPKTLPALLETVKLMSGMLQQQFTRADEAQDELKSVNDMFAAVGELMHRASEAARRDRTGA